MDAVWPPSLSFLLSQETGLTLLAPTVLFISINRVPFGIPHIPRPLLSPPVLCFLLCICSAFQRSNASCSDKRNKTDRNGGRRERQRCSVVTKSFHSVSDSDV